MQSIVQSMMQWMNGINSEKYDTSLVANLLLGPTVNEFLQEVQLSQRGRSMPRVVEYFG